MFHFIGSNGKTLFREWRVALLNITQKLLKTSLSFRCNFSSRCARPTQNPSLVELCKQLEHDHDVDIIKATRINLNLVKSILAIAAFLCAAFLSVTLGHLLIRSGGGSFSRSVVRSFGFFSALVLRFDSTTNLCSRGRLCGKPNKEKLYFSENPF